MSIQISSVETVWMNLMAHTFWLSVNLWLIGNNGAYNIDLLLFN